MLTNAFYLAPLAAVTALLFAWYFHRQMTAEDEGTEVMRRIAGHVRSGAMAYLFQQYRVMLVVFLILAGLLAVLAFGFNLQSRLLPLGLLAGGFFSALAGYFGMRTATAASSRTARAASHSLGHGLRVAFRSGAVMGLVVVGIGLLNVTVWFYLMNLVYPAHEGDGHNLVLTTTTILAFGMGASFQALFARVGGGIFTKAADVGADLVGKVEAGIPEDDPRNPATIADNVGDNVGDVAGMGADLYESYTGSILAAAALGAAAFIGQGQLQLNAVLFPMVIAGLGIFLSIIGVFVVKTREGASQRDLLGSLSRGINLSAGLIILASLGAAHLMGIPNPWGIWGAVVSGLLTGIVIGKSTEYFTASSYRPTREIAEQARTGPATLVISGTAVGMISTTIPVLAVVVGTTMAFLFATGFVTTDLSTGLYGIGVAAVGMLSTLGITLATDAYGPIADNAGGNAEMSGLGPEVRKRTDALDSLGNTTAATGKGFAIGSAALTALALLASYIEVVRASMARAGQVSLNLHGDREVEVAVASLSDFMEYFEVTLLNPLVIMGIFLGAMAAFLFCGLTINAVGRAAGKMVEEVRRQFRDIPGIMEGTAEPDYSRCVAISTKAAQAEMMLPSLLAIIIPVATGLVFGVAGVLGLLAGSLATGFVLAIYLSNSGGAWDNAKKYIEEGHLGGKGSDAHKATVIGDTIGDPFKDTSGPSLNILIKLMSMVSIVTAGFNIAITLL
ncbi:MAG: sodium-translocating pyrophosphatase [Puniceicoccaceae bacterium]|nr:MAG: sodium-translocating pyrophosphatase [Puniceicoccaceae bacterium]